MSERILEGYRSAAPELIQRFESLSSADIYAPLRKELPQSPARILDIGAATGRDAAWFTSLGHSVLAAEPVAAFRHAGAQLHATPKIEWIDDTLPSLPHVTARNETFDLITIAAVWHHLDIPARQMVFPTLRRLIAQNGKVILSIRHGPAAPTRIAHPTSTSDVVSLAQEQGLQKLREITAPSVQEGNQDAGVTWTWLVFQLQ